MFPTLKNLLNRTSVLAHLFESIAYGINDKKSMKSMTNEGANKAKCKNYKLVQQKMKYNMMMLHKASLSGKFFVFFCILTSLLFYKTKNITFCAICFTQHHVLQCFGNLIIMALKSKTLIWVPTIVVSLKVSFKIALLSKTLVLLDNQMRL